MSSELITKNISSLLSRIYVEIEQLSRSGLLDKNIFAENLMLQLFNIMYGYHFVNANVKSRKPNYPGIDLIDAEKKKFAKLVQTQRIRNFRIRLR